ncbi:MAG: hypothetical protein H6Q89_1988 [Myxococcaceae bacterium]|nr:hypothetical protein [Myxococcaceae bacterium]
MSVRDVKESFARVTTDRKIDVKDVDTVLQSAGAISVDEEKAIRAEADKFAGMMEPGAAAKLREKLGEVGSLRRQAAQINKSVETVAPRLTAEANEKLKLGVATKSFGGTQIPEAVKKAVTEAMAKGALAYDVREMKGDPVYDSSHGEPAMIIDGKFNPYGQDQQAVDSMAFNHTELTPAKIEADMTTPSTWQELNGYSADRKTAQFKTVTGVGNGKITELYDEATWPETFGRGAGGQKYASNFAILADGSVHAVPASRRTAAEPWRILTTASLGRGKQMLFNGHIHMEKGVVTYVGQSGRLGKLEEKGEGKFVDPVEIIKAWGFKTAPGLKVTQE